MTFQESEVVELKSVFVDDIKKEIIAFANCNGGKLYIGVQDDGGVIGVENADEVALRVSNMVRDTIKPDITMFLHYETLVAEGKQVVAVDIQRGTERPYYIAKKGLCPEGVYVRQGYSSVPASESAIRKMIKETDGDSFEEMRSLEQDLTFNYAQKEFETRDMLFGMAQYKTLGIVNADGIYTNLGLLLSEQCTHTIKVAVFEDNEQLIFKDRKEFSGSLFNQLVQSYDYIDYYNHTHSTFEGLRRIDVRDYPEVALREALLNAVVHREYAYNASTIIKIYSDRIEITTLGGLAGGITMNDIMLGASICRNPKLANILFRLELIEAYGTGITKIMNAYKNSNRKPKLEVSDNAFKITLPNINAEEERIQKNIVEDKQEGKIVDYTKFQGLVTRKEVEKMLNVSQTTSGRIVRQMAEKGLLVQEGKGKNTYYVLPKHK